MKQNYKYYAVARGNELGIFEDVELFQKAINNHPNPLFKASNSHQVITVWFEKNKQTLTDRVAKPVITNHKKRFKHKADQNMWFANIASSFRNGDLSWAFVITSNNKIIHENKGVVACYHCGDLIVGHMEAILQAVKYADKNNQKIRIFYIYDNLKSLAEGAFSINLPQARTFQVMISNYDNFEFIKLSNTSHPNYTKAIKLSEIALDEHETSLFD